MPAHKTPDPPCGDRRMYQRHIARGETPDQKCKDSNTKYQRDYRVDKRRGVKWEQLKLPKT